MNRCDLLIKDVSIYNSVYKKFFDADVYILDGKIFYNDIKKERNIDVKEVLDGSGKFMVPGLVDVHMHIESSMMTPISMTDRLAQCGVTTIISEPHEMANVNGLQGILDMMEAGRDSKIDILYGIPSCVPATDPSLETTGGIIDFEAMKSLLHNPDVACVGEVMNYRQVIKENDLEIGKLLKYVKEYEPGYVVEGHCPALLDQDLAKFVYIGIDSDHTEHNIEELKQRFFNGMYVELQDKMLRQDVVDFIMEHNLYGHFGFVTDDVMADTLMSQGHLDSVVRKAIKLGMKPEEAIYHATYTNAMRMKLTDRTMLTPGKIADFILLDDVEEFKIASTWKNGVCIFDKEKQQETRPAKSAFPESYHHTVQLDQVDADKLVVRSEDVLNGEVEVEVMKVSDGSTKTVRESTVLRVVDGEVIWENTPYLLAVVFERYGKEHKIGYGFVTGDAIKHGAVATTFAHDHHNLLAVGSTKEDLLLAINKVIAMQGGMAVADKGELKSALELNIGGILSEAPAKEIGDDLMKIRASLIEQGYQHYNPIMSLCTLSLLASPALKISDKGIVDVPNGKVIPLIKK